jgi:preprotein translocase subunit SecG
VGIIQSLLYVLIVLTSVFLILLVLIQRGKGGGLAGAFGGMGGSSAFGTKAGDVFTRVTIVTASIWMGLLMILVLLENHFPRQSGAVGLQAPTSSSDVPSPLGAPSGSGTSAPALPDSGKSAFPTAPSGSETVPEPPSPSPDKGVGGIPSGLGDIPAIPDSSSSTPK